MLVSSAQQSDSVIHNLAPCTPLPTFIVNIPVVFLLCLFCAPGLHYVIGWSSQLLLFVSVGKYDPRHLSTFPSSLGRWINMGCRIRRPLYPDPDSSSWPWWVSFHLLRFLEGLNVLEILTDHFSRSYYVPQCLLLAL